MKLKDVLKVSFGNIIEWYDFSLFGFYATVMSKVFFSQYSETAGLVMIFAMFGIGFVSRPLGGYFLGRIGDRYGHKIAINLAISGMGFATLFMGILPSYKLAGNWSIVFLIILRLIQGLSAGGQFTGVLTMWVNESKNHRALLAMTAVSVSTLGFLLASMMAFLFDAFLPVSLLANNWRFAFLSSIILFVIYWKIRPQDVANLKSKSMPKYSFITILCEQPQVFFGSMILAFVAGIFYFFIYVYLFNYLKLTFTLYGNITNILSSVQILFGCILFILFGWLADRYGKMRMFFFAMFTTPVFMFLLFSTHNLFYVFIIMLLLTISHGVMAGGANSTMIEIFYKKWRMTGSGVSYNIGMGLAGFGPMIMQYLVNHNNSYQPIVYLSIGCCMLGLLGLYLIRKSNGYSLIT